ncbi:hypothetical protein ACIQ9E_27575 [Streptomyces sp. NPDC094448]|uniref:hypothetical protein n=1 Tax=Streptomyces sp. NPDC094448 TaxID=3366063 RepID=UPI00381C7B3C
MTEETEDFAPTHVVPPGGLPAWETPGTSRPAASLDPLLPVLLADRHGDWGRIVCANGWSAWVDGRLLVAVPQPPPATGRPLTRTADQRPQLAKTGEALSRYRSAADELAAGRIDGGTFRSRTRGLRAGVVIDGESVWLYEAEHERWVYGDGVRLGTYAVSRAARDGAPPGAATGAGRESGTETEDVTGPRPEEPPGAAGMPEAPGTGPPPDAPPPTRVAGPGHGRAAPRPTRPGGEG